MPMRGELSIPALSLGNRRSAEETARIRLLSELSNPDFLAVVYFCIIGMLVAACFIQLIPNFGELSEVLQQYP